MKAKLEAAAKMEKARKLFEEIAQKYPDTETGKKARQKAGEIR